MNRDLIVYSGVSAAIIACFGLCTWTLTRQAEMLVERMDVMERRLSALQAMVAPPNVTTTPVANVCASANPPSWCDDPAVKSCPPGKDVAECFLDGPAAPPAGQVSSHSANPFDRFDTCTNHPNAPPPKGCDDPTSAGRR